MRGGERVNLGAIDVRRAYFHALAKRPIDSKLPPEDHQHGYCGKLLKAMYGTRDAASNWEQTYIEFMVDIGFKVGKVTPCLFIQSEKHLLVEVHGDDFTNTGCEGSLDWFKQELDKRFETKHKTRLGPDSTLRTRR